MLESLNTLQRIDLLQQLHAYINRLDFDSQLSSIEIDIENLQRIEEDAGGMFRPHTICKWGKIGMKISMDVGFIRRLSELSSEIQKEWIVIFMLHEMIHQYCYENGIDDTGHNEAFMQAAERFGLESVYESGELVFENLLNTDLLSFQYRAAPAQLI